jgi:hypothetical protein
LRTLLNLDDAKMPLALVSDKNDLHAEQLVEAHVVDHDHWVTDITVGLWQNLYNGDIGRFTAGLQYEYINRKLFAGLNATPTPSALIAPSTSNNIFFTSLRWYPKYPTF